MECQFKSNFEYRNYLTNHGANIISENNKIALHNANYFSNNKYALHATQIDNSVKSVNMVSTGELLDSPYLYNNFTSQEKPYGYSESDLKTNFINREINRYQLDSFKLVKPEQYFLNKK